MKKLFISQPMNGLSNEEIESKRKNLIDLAQRIVGEELEVIDSFFKDAPHDAKPLWYLGESFKKLSEADVVIFGEGHENARGCHMERLATDKYLCAKGVTVIVDHKCGFEVEKKA